MPRHRRLVVLGAVGGLLVASVLAGTVAKSRLERRYLTAALDVVETNYLRRGEVDWTEVRARAHEQSGNALTREQSHDSIRFALESLGGGHGRLLNAETAAALDRRTLADNPVPEGEVVAARLGYLRVPSFSGGDQGVVDEAATRLQRVVENIDSLRPCGWIVDLQTNDGGNMWPMLAGLGPLLGGGRLGAFVGADGEETVWSYADGAVLEGSRVRARAVGPVYRLASPLLPVAVLTSGVTASAGEAVAIAFLGRPAVRTFGQRTRGLTLSDERFTLSDGAVLNLGVSAYADRLSRVYPAGVDPDETGITAGSTRIPQLARDWLLRQPACTAA